MPSGLSVYALVSKTFNFKYGPFMFKTISIQMFALTWLIAFGVLYICMHVYKYAILFLFVDCLTLCEKQPFGNVWDR